MPKANINTDANNMEGGNDKSFLIYTMPLKFLAVGKGKRGSRMILLLLLAGGAFVLAGIGVFFLSSQLKPNIPQREVQSKKEIVQKNKIVVPSVKPDDVPSKEDQKKTDKEKPTPQEPQFVVEYLPSKDTDQDGLTDVEEVLFSTLTSRPDTDGDGHIDSSEILNFFSPIGLAPLDLVGSGLVKTFENSKYNYVLYYPSPWVVQGGETAKKVSFLPGTSGGEIQVSVEENPDNLSIVDWYIQKEPNVEPDEIKTFTMQNGLRGVKSKNGLLVYMLKPVKDAIIATQSINYVFVFEYVPGDRTVLDYQTTFQMMINSFNLVERATKEEKASSGSVAGKGQDETLDLANKKAENSVK